MVKMIYFHDIAGDSEQEVKDIVLELKSRDVRITETDIIPQTEPDWISDRFDVLFFDWGGMSCGNNFLASHCRFLLNKAYQFPSRIFVMASAMTAGAMKEVLQDVNEEFGREKPHNIFLSPTEAAEAIRDLIAERG